MKRFVIVFLIVCVVLFGAVFAFSKVARVTPLAWGHDKINVSFFSNEAIHGYDPVAYFKANEAVKGVADYSLEWGGAEWNFSSDANKELFAQTPNKFVPQFGGFCGYAVGKGFTADVDPEIFEIINGKLYLFIGEDEKAQWLEHKEENIRKCEELWY